MRGSGSGRTVSEPMVVNNLFSLEDVCENCIYKAVVCEHVDSFFPN